MVGVLFPQRKEAGYALYETMVSVGFIINFILPIYSSVLVQLSFHMTVVIILTVTVSVSFAVASHQTRHEQLISNTQENANSNNEIVSDLLY